MSLQSLQDYEIATLMRIALWLQEQGFQTEIHRYPSGGVWGGMVKFRMMLKDSYGHPSQKDLAVVWKMKGNQYCLYDTWLNHVDMPGLTKTITEILDENHGFI